MSVNGESGRLRFWLRSDRLKGHRMGEKTTGSIRHVSAGVSHPDSR